MNLKNQFCLYLETEEVNWNCRGAQGKKIRRALTNFCRNNKVDMVALQETRCSGSIAQNTI